MTCPRNRSLFQQTEPKEDPPRLIHVVSATVFFRSDWISIDSESKSIWVIVIRIGIRSRANSWISIRSTETDSESKHHVHSQAMHQML